MLRLRRFLMEKIVMIPIGLWILLMVEKGIMRMKNLTEKREMRRTVRTKNMLGKRDVQKKMWSKVMMLSVVAFQTGRILLVIS